MAITLLPVINEDDVAESHAEALPLWTTTTTTRGIRSGIGIGNGHEVEEGYGYIQRSGQESEIEEKMASSWAGQPSIRGSSESMRMALLTFSLVGLQ